MAVVYYLVGTLNLVFGVFHFNRPIVISTLIGLVLGDLQTGIILGATFEAVFLGVIAIGGSAPADATIGAAFGTAMAIVAGLDPETALAIAMPVSILGLSIGMLPMSVIYPLVVPRAQKYAEEGNSKGVFRITILLGMLMYVFGSVIMFVGVYFGAEAVGAALAALPPPSS